MSSVEPPSKDLRSSDVPALLAGLQTVRQWTRTWTGRVKLLTIVCVLGIVPALSYSGFCFSQKRFLSEVEFADVAIEHLIGLTTHTLRIRVPDGINFKSVKVVRYKSVAEFRSSNPDCCAIVPHNSEVKYVSFCTQLFGRAAKSVSLAYTLNYLDDDASVKSAPFKSEAIIGNCGSVLH